MSEHNSFDKIKFENQFRNLLKTEKDFGQFILNAFVFGTAYVVGGYVRDFIVGKSSRDIDLIFDSHRDLEELLTTLSCQYSKNRHGGIKLYFQNITVDIWEIKNNWAFKNQLVYLNEKDILHSIAKGCFYNYDALVVNLHTFNYNIRYFNQFIKLKELDILQKNSQYKKLNPTIEANIIRALYIKKMYPTVKFTNNVESYLLMQLKRLSFTSGDSINVIKTILKVKNSYFKYNKMLEADLVNDIRKFLNKAYIKDNPCLDFDGDHIPQPNKKPQRKTIV